MLAAVAHRGPLRIQRVFQPEPSGTRPCHVYLLHPPGGLASQDQLDIEIELDPGAAALFTAPSAQKVYRSVGATSRQSVRVRAQEDSCIEWLPPETIVFSEARTELRLTVDLAPRARFVGADVLCLGRPASGAPFRSGRIVQRIEIRRCEQPLLSERLELSEDSPLLGGAFGTGSYTAIGTLVATAPPTDRLDVDLALVRGALRCRDGERIGATAVRGLVVVRFLGFQAERAHALLRRAWALLRPSVVGSPPIEPRVWAV